MGAADDMLNTGVMVVEPGLEALEVARGVADSNAELRSLPAPVTNSPSDMTKAARLARGDVAHGPATGYMESRSRLRESRRWASRSLHPSTAEPSAEHRGAFG